MSAGSINLVMDSARGQWQEFVWTILFAGGFALLMVAKFTGQLDDKTSFFPKKSGILFFSALLGCTLGAWYGYANSINAAHTISCAAGSDTLVLEYPHKKVVVFAQLTTQVPALASYRGGHPWRLRFHSNGQAYDTVQLGVHEVRTAIDFASRCGIRSSKSP